jgi:ATPase subunit of ABC transporter with duplicated ATPase domains
MRHQTEKRARIAKTLDKRVEQLQKVAVAQPGRRERRYHVTFPPPPHTGRVVIEAEGLAKAYGTSAAVFEDVSFAVERGQRLLVMGLNGAGKTSLLRILAGLAEATDGTWRTGVGVSLGYYAQEHEGIVAGRSVIEHMRQESEAPETELRGLLGMFGLVGEKAFQDASTLSGGEKTKLALAQLVAGRHNCLLLDEPTNNLDPPSREGIGRALSDWPGAMVVVSHDAGFVAELEPDRVLMMPDGTEDAWNSGLLDLVSLA